MFFKKSKCATNYVISFEVQWNLDLRKPDLRNNLDLRKIVARVRTTEASFAECVYFFFR